jgi:hypothetical protein
VGAFQRLLRRNQTLKLDESAAKTNPERNLLQGLYKPGTIVENNVPQRYGLFTQELEVVD